jgi:hypothetical protein
VSEHLIAFLIGLGVLSAALSMLALGVSVWMANEHRIDRLRRAWDDE